MHKWLFSVILALPMPLCAAELALREAINFAVQHAPGLSAAQLKTEVAVLGERNAKAAFFPTLETSLQHVYLENNPSVLGDGANQSFGVQIKENLYDNHQSILTFDETKLKSKLAQFNFNHERDRLVFSVCQQYLKISLLYHNEAVYERESQLVTKQYKLMEGQYKQGLKTRRDYLRFKAQVRRSELGLSGIRNEMKQAYTDLMQLLAWQEEKAESLQIAALKPEDEALPKPTGVTVKDNLRLKLQQLEHDLSKVEEDKVRRGTGPRINVFAEAHYTNPDYVDSGEFSDDSDYTGWSVGLTLDYTIWDWGIRSRKRLAAAKTVLAKGEEVRSEEGRLQAEARKVTLELNELAKNLKLQKELWDLEKSNFDFILSEYHKGQMSYLDMMTALKEVTSAELSYNKAAFTYQHKVYEAYFYEGKLYEKLVGA